MRLPLLILALACLAASKGAHVDPIKVRFHGLQIIQTPDSQLWSESEIARTHWPLLAFVAKGRTNSAYGFQMRVRGQAGDRTNRLYLVVDKSGKLIKPDPKYFVRDDPWARVLPPPPLAKSTVKQSLSVAPPRSITIAWQSCDDSTSSFRVYLTKDLKTWTLVTETPDFSTSVLCDQSGPNFFGVKAVNAFGESAFGTKSPCQ